MHLSNKTWSNNGPCWHSRTKLSQNDSRFSCDSAFQVFYRQMLIDSFRKQEESNLGFFLLIQTTVYLLGFRSPTSSEEVVVLRLLVLMVAGFWRQLWRLVICSLCQGFLLSQRLLTLMDWSGSLSSLPPSEFFKQNWNFIFVTYADLNANITFL